MGYLKEDDLRSMGVKFGRGVLVSDKCSLYGAENIHFGDNVRVDDFCVISGVNGYVIFGNHIHVAPYCGLYGGGGIIVEDFCGLSSCTSLYSTNDNYSGDYLIGPTMFDDYRKVDVRTIKLSKYTTIGTHAAVLPGVTFGEGAILGAFSLATKAVEQWSIYSGVPAKKIAKRKNGLIEKAKKMATDWKLGLGE